MTASFNLIDEPWIPCTMLDRSRQKFGLCDVLARAHDIAEINGESPLVIAALHRLLLAVLHRNFSVRDEAQWGALWAREWWDATVIGRYFELWRHRFDLFDAERPFYQVAQLASKRPPSSAAKLTFNDDNNATLFSHLAVSEPPSLTPAEAARQMLGLLTFDVGGRKSDPPGISAYAAPLNTGAVVLAKGDNLFKTLMLNLCRYAPEESDPWDFDRDKDIPAWERDEATRPDDRHPNGYIDLLTWQSRRTRLQPELDADGKTVVRNVVIMKGFQLPKDYTLYGKETMLAFQQRPKAPANQDPWPAVTFKEDKALWRDSLALMQSTDANSERPKNLAWLADLAYEDIISHSTMVRLDVFGLGSNRAKVEFWRHEQLSLSLRYLDDDDLVGSIRMALQWTEKAAEDLNRVIWQMAAKILAASQEGNPDRSAVQSLVNHLGATRTYWSRLEGPFKQLMIDLPDDMDEDGDYGVEELPEWKDTLRATIWNAFNEATRGLERSPRTLKAVAVAERRLAARTREYLSVQEEA